MWQCAWHVWLLRKLSPKLSGFLAKNTFDKSIVYYLDMERKTTSENRIQKMITDQGSAKEKMKRKYNGKLLSLWETCEIWDRMTNLWFNFVPLSIIIIMDIKVQKQTKWIEILRSQVNKTTFRNPCNVAPVSREVGVVKRILMIHSVCMVRKTARTK